MEDYLAQQNQIFENATVEEGFPGEDTMTVVTMTPLLSQDDRKQITCDCSECLAITKQVKTLIVHEVVPSMYVGFATQMEKRTTTKLKNLHNSTAAKYKEAVKSLKEIVKKFEKIEKQTETLSRTEFKKLLEEKEKTDETIKSQARKVSEFSLALGRVSIPSIREDIAEILRHEKVDSVTDRVDYLEILTKHLTVSQTLLGPLKICLYYNGGAHVRKTKNSCLSKDGYHHPHVNKENRICFGQAQSRADHILNHNSLMSRFDFVLGLLSGYNGGSPFSSINNWAPAFCSSCNEPLEKKQKHSCNCGSALCSKCHKSGKTGCCGEKVCPMCATKCTNCQATTCKHLVWNKESELIQGCSSCKKEGCSQCIMCCHSCDSTEFLCKDCSFYCETCGTSQCKECANVEEMEPNTFKYTCKLGHENIISRDEGEKVQTISMEEVGEVPLQEEQTGPQIVVRRVGN